RPDDVPALLALLGDRSWWVRQQAADTLVALPRMALAQLEALLGEVGDRYGREALQRAIAARRAQEAAP
ncbi:MAG TPA: HEAT repeat domain-containing protein, partial [Lysobacter sp.]